MFLFSYIKPALVTTGAIYITTINEIAGCISIVGSAIFVIVKIYKELKSK